MKQSEVTYKYDDHQVVYIVEKEDGSYGPVQAGSYMFATFPGDYKEKLAYWAKQNLEDLTSGKVSTVGYYMQCLRMTPDDVSDRTGIRKGLVKKHMAPAGFAGATVAMLARYAEVFGVPLAGMLAIVAQAAQGARVVLRETKNPHAVIAVAEESR